MKHILPITILLIILSIACSKHTANQSGKNESYIIDFEQCMDAEQAMKISDIADTVEYLELKTPEGTFVSRIWDIILVDDFLFLKTTYGIFKFTREGEFITEIGHSGQGPGEYSMVSSIAVDTIKKEIILADSDHVLFYDLDGNFLRREKWGFLYSIGVSDSILWVCTHSIYIYQYTTFALNYQGDTVASMPNSNYSMKSLNDGVRSSTPKSLKMFYSYNGSLYLKGTERCDTIFQLSGKTSTPYAYINRGKYKLPMEYEAWYSWDEFNKHGSHYWGVSAVSEDDHYLYLQAIRFRPIDGNIYNHNEENFRYIVYDKEKKKGFVTKDNKDTRFKDDILGGPPIWPRWTTDDYYMNVIEPHDLVDAVEKGNYTVSPSLAKQLAGFENGTNQLIVLCRKKK